MAEASLLSDLCTICHSPPKYRCPRCSARTCSLACSKRHKQWAQCSGVRNPAAYLKRHELATPKHFDQDYNFISAIERNMETAERNVTARGVRLQETRAPPRRDGPMKGEVNLRQALEKSGVVVERAPPGMKRSLQNKTSWSKNQRCISWTVEWIANDGTVDLGTCLDTQTLSQAYTKHTGLRPPTKKRKLAKKQKAWSDAAPAPEPDADRQAPTELASTTTTLPIGLPDANPPSHSATEQSPPATSPSPISQQSVKVPSPRAPSLNTSPLSPSFYLHIPNPRTPSSTPTLLPLSSARPLSTLLRNHLIREFPTIYVLPYPPEELPSEKYALQRDFAGEVAAELEGILDGGGDRGTRTLDGGGRGTRTLDGGMNEGEERSAGKAVDDRTESGDRQEGDKHDSDRHNSAGGDRARSDGSTAEKGSGRATQEMDEPVGGALATGPDELSWIMRAVS